MLQCELRPRVVATLLLLLLLLLPAVAAAAACAGVCENVTVDSVASLSSHPGAGAANYTNNMSCCWRLSAPARKLLSARFTLRQLRNYPDTMARDYVQFYDGGGVETRDESALIGTAHHDDCGDYVSTANVMTVLFVTDESGTGLGFRLQLQALDPVVQDNGTIVSHSGIGNSSYAAGIICTWRVASSAGTRIMARFSQLLLRRHRDYVYLHSGFNLSVNQIAELTEFTNRTYATADNRLTVRFKTGSGSGDRLGFRLHFSSAADRGENCDGKTVTVEAGGGGSVVSHAGAGQYNLDNSMSCHWRISVPAGKVVKAWFTYLDVCPYPHILMSCSSVLLSNSPNFTSFLHNPSLIGTVSTVACTSYVSESNTMTVRLVTHEKSPGLGFRLQFEAVDAVTERGIIESHPTAGGIECKWQVTVPPRGVVKARFTILELDSGDVLDMETGLIWKLFVTQSMRVSEFETDANHLVVKSRIVYSGRSRGFRIEYEADYGIVKHLPTILGVTAGVTALLSASTVGCVWYRMHK